MKMLTGREPRAASAGRMFLRGGLIFLLAHTLFLGLALVLRAVA